LTRVINLTKGQTALVDSEDYKKLTEYEWYFEENGYACRRKTYGYYDSKKVYMHREVIGDIPPKMVVDHINGNKTDNRKDNLRVVSQSENAFNSGIRVNNTSGYKGVSKFEDRWRARIYINGKEKHLGLFTSKEEAAKAYNEVAKLHYDGVAFLNEIEMEEIS